MKRCDFCSGYDPGRCRYTEPGPVIKFTEGEWRPIPGYESLYEASPNGCIRNARNQRVLKQSRHSKGYRTVGLSRQKKVKTIGIHRLIACTFIGQCTNGCFVNHKDGNKAHNHVLNLEYMSSWGNASHYHSHLR